MNDHLKGLLLTTLGIFLVLPDTLFVRIISAEAMITAFWRCIFSGGIILIFILLTQGLSPFRAVFRAGWPAAIYTLIIATTTPAIVLAVRNTSVANVVFIFACMPIFAVIFSRIFLAEAIKTRMILTMLAVFIGLGVIAYGSQSSEISSWKGDLWALYISISYAAGLTAVRRVKDTSMVPTLPMAYLGTAFLLLFFIDPLPALSAEWPLFISHGGFIAAGSCLIAIGPRYISAAEVSLVILLESALAPVLVWFVVGENPGKLAIIGGAIVILAMVTSNVYELLRSRKKQTDSS